MTVRSLLYLLGAALTAAGCFFPWSCQQLSAISWQCPTALTLRYMQGGAFGRLELQDSVGGGAFLTLLLTAVILLLAFPPAQLNRRPVGLAIVSSAALLFVVASQLTARLTALIRSSDALAGIPILTLVIVCAGAVLTLIAGAMDQRALSQRLA